MASRPQQASNEALAKFSSVLKNKNNKALLEGALTKGLDMSRFIKCAWIQAQISPDVAELAQKNPTSVFRAMVQCAQMGLYPDGVNGDAYLVKYGNQCVAIRGYKGLMRLFAASPVSAPMPFVYDVIREHDTWDLEMGANPFFTHKPAKENRGEVTHYYAVARFSDGSIMPKVMTVEDVEKFKSYTKSKAFWDSPHEPTKQAMRIKTVIRQLIKMLPLAETARADMEREEALEAGKVDVEQLLELNGGETHVYGDGVKKSQPVSDGRAAAAMELTDGGRHAFDESGTIPPDNPEAGFYPETGGEPSGAPDPFTASEFDE